MENGFMCWVRVRRSLSVTSRKLVCRVALRMSKTSFLTSFWWQLVHNLQTGYVVVYLEMNVIRACRLLVNSSLISRLAWRNFHPQPLITHFVSDCQHWCYFLIVRCISVVYYWSLLSVCYQTVILHCTLKHTTMSHYLRAYPSPSLPGRKSGMAALSIFAKGKSNSK